MSNFIGRLIETWNSQGTAPTPRRQTGRLIFTSGKAGLSISSITVLDSTHLKVNFTTGAKNNVALVTQANYVITPALVVHTITPEAVTHPTYVTVTVDEMKDGQAYGLEIQNVEMA